MKNCAGLVLLVSAIASAPQQAPVRDPHPATAGAAATVSGRVFDDQGTPLPGAVVYLIGGGPPGARTAITAEDGRFAWTGVDPALYTLAASKGGYPPIEYGQTRPGGPGTPMQIEAGARLTLDIRMPRGAVIAGVVLDEEGQPVTGRQITVLRASASLTSSRQGGYLSSDSRGRYRAFGLRADTYRVTTDPISSAGDTAHSVIVTVAAGEERDGIDLSIAPPVQTTLLTVSATAADGQPLGPLQVQLRWPGATRYTYSYGTLNADGSRTFSDVAAGRYRVAAQARPPRPTPGQPSSSTTYWGGADVSVEGDRPASVAVTLTPGVRIRGQIAFAGGSRPSTRALHVHTPRTR